MSEKTPQIHQGGCLCGAVRYEAEGQPIVVVHCHCEDCQRVSGAGHSTGAMFRIERIRLSGQVAEYSLKSDDGNEVTRVFCPVCGSSILGRNTVTKGYVTITLGTFDDSSQFEPQAVIFARNRKPWDVIDESLPAWETEPDWNPDDGF